MSTNLQTIHEILKKNDLSHKVMDKEGYIYLGSDTKVYKDKDNESVMVIVISVEEGGGFVKFIAPNLYTNHNSAHKVSVLETCMSITCHVKMIQCLFNESDGEIRFEIHLPLEDNHMTDKQLMRALFFLVKTADSFDSAFCSAIETGEVTVSKLLEEHSKKAKLAQLIKDTPSDELDQLIQQLEFANNSSSSEMQALTH